MASSFLFLMIRCKLQLCVIGGKYYSSLSLADLEWEMVFQSHGIVGYKGFMAHLVQTFHLFEEIKTYKS